MRGKYFKNSFSSFPAAGGGSIDSAEMERIKADMEAEVRKNEEEMEEMKRSWEEKMKEQEREYQVKTPNVQKNFFFKFRLL